MSRSEVIVETTSRLHFGFIDLRGDLGRIYGSVGAAIDYPNVVLEASHSKLSVSGPDAMSVKEIMKLFLQHYSLPPTCSIRVNRSIPRHVGLGSGTQLALATARSMATLFGIGASTRELAEVTGRGSLSGIGIAAFERGGFIVDGGHRFKEDRKLRHISAPIIYRYPFPRDWIFVIATPAVKRGLSGRVEKSVLGSLPLIPESRVGRISRIVLMRMIPSLLEKDIQGFGEGLSELEILTGKSFMSFQKGIFHSKLVQQCVDLMSKEGAYGAGQSSWGPTVYGLVKGRRQAEDLRATVKSFLNRKSGGEVFYSKVRNRGALIRRVSE